MKNISKKFFYRLLIIISVNLSLIGPSYAEDVFRLDDDICIQCPAKSENILEKPDYSKMMLLNTFVPGSAQLTLGQNNEAYLYMSSIPISLIGQGLLLLYFLDKGFVTEPYTENDKHYLIGYANKSNDKKWMLYTGLTMAIYANLLSSYSSYSAHRDYMDKYNSENSLRKGRENLLDLALSPYKPENVFNWDVMPFFPLSVVAGVQGGDFNSIGKYFQRENVPFMGFNVNPVGGLALNLIATIILVTANAAWEEIMYRGLLLETSGITYSSVNFGLAHLGNMLLPDTSVEDTLLQTGFATLFGFYAAHKTEQNDYDFRKMIALHFWHNVTSSTLGYMVNPDKSLFIINCSFKF